MSSINLMPSRWKIQQKTLYHCVYPLIRLNKHLDCSGSFSWTDWDRNVVIQRWLSNDKLTDTIKAHFWKECVACFGERIILEGVSLLLSNLILLRWISKYMLNLLPEQWAQCRNTVLEKCLPLIQEVWEWQGRANILVWRENVLYVPDTHWANFREFPIKWSYETVETNFQT